MFAQRLRSFKISFKVFPFDACRLSQSIRQNGLAEYGIPASIRFDRIAVSNILDVNYVGLQAVLTHWAPLLAKNSTAVIVGYFMNWSVRQEDGRAGGAGSSVCANLAGHMMNKIKVSKQLWKLYFVNTLPIKATVDKDKMRNPGTYT
jgi:hypothetical protein